SYNAGVIVLMFFIGGFIELMMRSGGAFAFAQSMGKYINSKKKAQLAVYFAGIMIFFSDLGTPLIVGPIFSPFFKKLKLSREKLAFILDSTASPIAVLVPFIGWGVFIIGLLQKEFEILNIDLSDYESFVKAIPYNLYPILAVTIIPMVIMGTLDLGPMGKAETSNYELEEKDIKNSKYYSENAKPIFIWLPLMVLLLTLFTMLGTKFLTSRVPGGEFRGALTSGYLYAAMTLALLLIVNKSKNVKEIFSIYLSGMTKMGEIAIILLLAWSLGAVNKELGATEYIIGFVKSFEVSSGAIPLIAFIFGAIISFATGSSWGTYSIMIPIVIPMAIALDAPLYISIGAVLSGGLFGDHVSPISDTTILSSAGAECNHIEHVKTQFPYAILNGSISALLFTVGGFYESNFILVGAILLQIIVLVAIKIIMVKKSEAVSENIIYEGGVE
ncbi:MAG: Na+/H+ antiporter NhaC family protein, partial [Fusobacteriaceae bacterium]